MSKKLPEVDLAADIAPIVEKYFPANQHRYFMNLASKLLEPLALHKQQGLWLPDDNWGNNTAHCLLVAGRSDAYAQHIELPSIYRDELLIGSILHDFFKKGEKEIVTRIGLNWNAFATANQAAEHIMREAGFSERCIRIAGSAGHSSLIRIETVLNSEKILSKDMPDLILHSVDDFTIDCKPVSLCENGVNDLDRRTEKNKANPRYAVLNEEGRQYFNGETAFEAQARIGHLLEKKLAEWLLIAIRVEVDPLMVPEIIDEELMRVIEIDSRMEVKKK